MSQIGLIIRREFNERARKKSFIIVTLLTPLLFIAMMAIPTLIVIFSKSDLREIVVVDKSGVIANRLESGDEIKYEVTDLNLEQARAKYVDKFAVLYIGENVVLEPKNVQLYTNSSSSIKIQGIIEGNLEDVIENIRENSYNIENLKQIIKDINADVSLQTFSNEEAEDGGPQSHSSMLSTAMGYGLGFILYMFLLIYGSMVMMSVIEEKNSRVLEVMVSSVRPFNLMMGKILGIASVAVTQIAIWGVMIFIGIAFILPAIMPDDMTATIEAMQQSSEQMASMDGGMMAAQGMDSEMMAAAGLDSEMMTAIATLMDPMYLFKIVAFLLLFTIGGYLLYSAMYAAVGSAVENVMDAQQLQTPITIPIIISIFAMMAVINDPNSQIAFWFSIIPFTSPVVMLARIPYDIPAWEIVLSLVILYGTFVVMVYFAAKIYRVGIFMYGKKPSLKELYKWMKYKY